MTLTSHCRSERGQSLVIVLIFMTVLIGMAAAVLDVGSWYRADRKLQANVDAAALAGAQALPDSSSEASSLALDYADRNDGGVAPSGISFESGVRPNDTISVKGSRPAPGFFAKLFGFNSVTVGASAKARASVPSTARWVAPIAVDEKHPFLMPTPDSTPRFGEPTSVNLIHLHKPGSGTAAGGFGLINLDRSRSGDIGASTVGEWILNGFDGNMELGDYNSAPSTEFNSLHIKEALDGKIGDELLFPIYRSIKRSGSTATFEIVGWVAFHLTGYDVHGDEGTLYGEFVRVIWEGVGSETEDSADFGVRVIHLVE